MALNSARFQPLKGFEAVENCNTPTPSNHLTIMHTPQTMPPPPSVSMPVALVADVQDALLMVMTDLQRLEGLLDHATAPQTTVTAPYQWNGDPGWRAVYNRVTPENADYLRQKGEERRRRMLAKKPQKD